MKVAIINAPPFGIHEPQYDTPDFTRLSLAVLAAYVRDRGFSDLLLVDAKFERLSYQDIRKRLHDFNPDVVAHTAFTNEIHQSHKVAGLVRDLAKTLGKEIINVIGGVHCTALPERTLQEFPFFDLVVMGEGEQTFAELLECLDGRGKPLNEIPGLAFRTPRNPQSIIRTGARPSMHDPTILPLPAWDLLPKSPEYLVMSSRGCPYSCSFCLNPNGRIVRKRAVSHFLREVEWLVSRNGGKASFNICDEIFTIDKKRTHEILDGLMDIGFGKSKHLSFYAQTHVNTVDEPLLHKIAQAGCKFLGFGLESGNNEVLKTVGKGTDLRQIHTIMALAKRCKVNVHTFFILGQPDETIYSALKTILLAVRVNPIAPRFGVMVPYPGTKVWEWAKKGEKGYFLKSENWNDYNKQLGNALGCKGISRRQMELLQLIGYIMMYLINLRFLDLLRFAWAYRTEGFAILRKIIFGYIAEPRDTKAQAFEIQASPSTNVAPDLSRFSYLKTSVGAQYFGRALTATPQFVNE